MKNKIIYEIKITKKSKVVISIADFKGQKRLDIRLNVAILKDNGELFFFPIKKGINVPIKIRDELVKGLQQIEIDSCEEE